MNSFTITINGEDVTAYAYYPFSGELTLDRSLDQAYIELKASPRSKPYPPFSEVVVTPNTGEATTFIMASDDVDTIIKIGLSNHRILLCEETKKLERIICPGKTFVQPLVRNYSKSVTATPHKVDGIETQYDISQLITLADLSRSIAPPSSDYYNTSDSYTKSVEISSVVTEGETPPSMTDVFETTNPNVESNYNRYLLGFAIVAINRNLEVVSVVKGSVGIVSANPNPTLSTLPVAGYTLYYIANYRLSPISGGNNIISYVAAAYDFAVIPPDTVQKPPLYITDVTQQLLEIAEPIRYGEAPRYKLNSADAAKYARTPCAELNFPNGATLRENLDEIAGIIHCITRLKNGEIYFDPIGDPNQIDIDKLGDPVSIRSSANIEKYATHLDSFVDNLMNAQNPSQGAISDPFFGIYKTPRALTSTTDARVTVKNCRIDTVFGIQKLENLTVWYNNNEYDITAFVYEKKEYDLLETNTGVYPYAKAYALYYTQGQKGIDGLSHRVESGLGDAFKNPAIANILSIVTGQNIDWKDDLDGDAILNYMFNVTYIPAVRGRVRAAKTNIQDIKTPCAMAFNQSTPRLSSVNFGERLKGETAMLGEPEYHLVFKTTDLDAVLNSIGKTWALFGALVYVSKITYKIWPTYVIAEFIFSKNFNQLGRFISINNSFRQFEVDDNSQEECIVYEDYAVFSFEEPNVYKSTFDDLNVRLALRDTIVPLYSGEGAGNHEITLAHVITGNTMKNDKLEEFNDIVLPVQSLALGNSLMFNFAFEDNYSAGKFLQAQAGYKLTREAAYGDPLYSEAKYLSFELANHTDYQYDDATPKLSLGDAIPLNPNGLLFDPVFSTGAKPLIINKSSRDAPNITYQIHHVTDSNIVFGKPLTTTNPLVGFWNKAATYLIALPFELNPLSPPIPNNYDYGANPLRVGYNIDGVEYPNLPAVKLTDLNVDFYNTEFNALKIDLERAFESLKQQYNYSGGSTPKSFAIIGNFNAEFIIGANAIFWLSDNTLRPLIVYLTHSI